MRTIWRIAEKLNVANELFTLNGGKNLEFLTDSIKFVLAQREIVFIYCKTSLCYMRLLCNAGRTEPFSCQTYDQQQHGGNFTSVV